MIENTSNFNYLTRACFPVTIANKSLLWHTYTPLFTSRCGVDTSAVGLVSTFSCLGTGCKRDVRCLGIGGTRRERIWIAGDATVGAAVGNVDSVAQVARHRRGRRASSPCREKLEKTAVTGAKKPVEIPARRYLAQAVARRGRTRPGGPGGGHTRHW